MGRGGEAVVSPRTFALQYGHLQLDNGLQALLICDPETDKASAALDVNIGSLADPQELPGLAHFLEHMLFYSSQEYPEEGAYSKFIAEHGGSTNAYTAAEDTNYHFDVNHDHLEGALDRFAQFFLCPLISEDGVEREANAVDSEHGKNLNTDAWRFSQLWRSHSNSQHPYSHFHTGSLETLITRPQAEGISVHEAVRDFAARQYSANIMRLVVYGRESISELEALVRSKFISVVNKDLQPSHYPGDAILPEQQCCLIRAVPQKEKDSLEIQWPISPQQSLYKTHPSTYLSHLLGHEGEGSIFAVLKAKGWATYLSSGEGGSSFSGKSFFSLKIMLTKEGQQHAEEVIGLVFAYLQMLRQPGGVTNQRFEEMQALMRMRFEYSDKINPGRLTSALAQILQHVPAEHCLLALHNVPLEFDAEGINAVLAEMTPENVRIMWASKDFKYGDPCSSQVQQSQEGSQEQVFNSCNEGKTDKIEPIYGTEHSIEPVPEAWLKHWSLDIVDSGLHLPKENPFIPTDFSMVEDGKLGRKQDEPAVIHETNLVQLWHKLETSFGNPKAVVYLAFHCPEAYSCPENAVLTRLFVKLLEDRLSEISYDAELAGLSYQLLNTTSGFLVTFGGYNHKLMTLVELVLSSAVSFKVDEERFLVQQEAVAREYANQRYEQPYQTAIYESSVVHELRRWHTSEYEAIIGRLNAQDLTAFYGRLLRSCWVQGYASGNLKEAEALQLAAHVEHLLKKNSLKYLQEVVKAQPLFRSQRPEARVVKLQAGKPALLRMPVPNPANENSAILLSYQVGPDNAAQNVLGELWVKISKQEAFQQLRSQQQLGYIVFLSAWGNLTVRSLAFILQSTAYPAELLEERCEAFLLEAARLLKDMPESEFAQQVEELAKAKLEKPKRLREKAAKEWREIDEGTLIFQRPEIEVSALRTQTKADLVSFFQANVFDPSFRRKLSVWIEGAQGTETVASQSNGSALKDTALNGTALNGTSNGEASSHSSLPKGRDTDADESSSANGQAPARNRSSGSHPHSKEMPEVEIIADVSAFKRRQELFPSPK